jgi:hypothetical protein
MGLWVTVKYHPKENTVTRGVFYYPEQKYCNDLKLSPKSNCNKNEPRVTITKLSLPFTF